MILQDLLGDLPFARFLEEYWQRIPYSRPGGAAPFAALGTWEVMDAILAGPADVLAAKDGRLGQGDPRELYASGHTVLVRNAEKRHPGLAELAGGFDSAFRAPVNVHLYCTPAGGRGFGWHYDAEDVFILQTRGAKEYSLRKNTVNPLPVAEAIPEDMRFEAEVTPLFRCALRAGDWLYIPAGWWHVADAKEESITLAVGVMSPTALDVLDFLRRRLASSVFWRQRLPVVGEAVEDRTRQVFRSLGRDLAILLDDEKAAREFLEGRRR